MGKYSSLLQVMPERVQNYHNTNWHTIRNEWVEGLKSRCMNLGKRTNLVNFIVIGIFINKNTYIIPTNAYVTYRSVKDTDNVSRHFFLLKVHT